MWFHISGIGWRGLPPNSVMIGALGALQTKFLCGNAELVTTRKLLFGCKHSMYDHNIIIMHVPTLSGQFFYLV